MEEQLLNTVANSAWYKSTVEMLEEAVAGRSIKTMICLGIGSMEENYAALNQYAIAILLADYFNVEKSSVMVFDPIMTENDKKIVANSGFKVGANELDFDHRPEPSNDAILLYMPHVPHAVSQRVIRHIMERGRLGNTICLGNIFSKIRDLVCTAWFRHLINDKKYREGSCIGYPNVPYYLHNFAISIFPARERPAIANEGEATRNGPPDQ